MVACKQVVALCLLGALAATQAAPTGFIRISNQRFVDANCEEFLPNGFMTWQFMEAAANASNTLLVDIGVDPVDSTFQNAANNNFTIVRAFGHGVLPTFALQPSPGNYSESAFRALDTIIAKAAQYGIRLILTFADNWSLADSKHNYLTWSGQTTNNSFFTETGPGSAYALYTNHIGVMANRTNTLTGVKYSQDPTIFAWDIMNEPRCDCTPAQLDPPPTNPECLPGCADLVTTWINNVAAYYKTVFPNTLLTVGEEGFWGAYSSQQSQNPGNGWAPITGNNFTDQHASRNVDFTAIHMWPSQWSNAGQAALGPDFVVQWIDQHATASAALGKPLIVEEFGVAVNSSSDSVDMASRLAIYQTAYMALNSSITSSAAGAASILRGVSFFQYSYTNPNPYNNPLQLATTDTAFETIAVPTAKYAANLVANKALAGCQKVAAPPAPSTRSTGTTAAAGRRLLSA